VPAISELTTLETDSIDTETLLGTLFHRRQSAQMSGCLLHINMAMRQTKTKNPATECIPPPRQTIILKFAVICVHLHSLGGAS